jgi:hypothetical protein
MRKKLNLIVLVTLLTGVSVSAAVATGEDILGKSGQYTFFIKPDPCAPMTYYQKLVPCIVRETVPVPRRVWLTYQVPVPARQTIPVVINETPIGCAGGPIPCAECSPSPSSGPGTREVWGPRLVTVRVPDVVFTPREVTRKVMLPQWFAVTEEPRPPRQVRKVRTDG